MARAPLRQKKPSSVSVCGKLLKSGQTVTVPGTAIGDRERKLAERKLIRIRDSNKVGQVQIVCLLKG